MKINTQAFRVPVLYRGLYDKNLLVLLSDEEPNSLVWRAQNFEIFNVICNLKMQLPK